MGLLTGLSTGTYTYAMFTSKFSLISQEKRDKMLEEAKVYGAYATATKFYKQVGMSWRRLYEILRGQVTGVEIKKLRVTEVKGKEIKEKPLTKEEKEFLDRLSKGESTLEETSRFVAVKVFEQMLRNPYKFQYLDFFRTEMLKIKKEETAIKENWAKELIAKMFAGKLPPKNCPSCGHDLSSSHVIEGRIVNERELPSSI